MTAEPVAEFVQITVTSFSQLTNEVITITTVTIKVVKFFFITFGFN